MNQCVYITHVVLDVIALVVRICFISSTSPYVIQSVGIVFDMISIKDLFKVAHFDLFCFSTILVILQSYLVISFFNMDDKLLAAVNQSIFQGNIFNA